MLTFTAPDDKQGFCFQFIGGSTGSKNGGLICSNTSLISSDTSLIFSSNENSGLDTCSFYNGPSDSTIAIFGESCESSGSIAYSGDGESCGSIAYSTGGESCGSVASSDSGFGGGCSYSC